MVGWFERWMVGWGQLGTKRIFVYFLFGLLTVPLASPAAAQEEAQTLEWLIVELWPDYDRPSVLVLITGALPEGAPLAATVTIPLPTEATVNAVARISETSEMVNDIEFTQGSDFLTLQTPERRFRVEYYMPYAGSELLHRFSFQWQSELDVEQLAVTVQQPRLAPSIDISPQPDVVGEGNDGLQYYSLPVEPVAAGQVYAVDVQYTLEQAGLSVDAAAPGIEQETGPNRPFLLGVVGGILVLALALALLWPRIRAAGRAATRKQVPDPPATSEPVSYCHNCGQQAQSGDRFCRQCGTELKSL